MHIFHIRCLEAGVTEQKVIKEKLKLRKLISGNSFLRNNQMLTVIVSKVAKRRLQYN